MSLFNVTCLSDVTQEQYECVCCAGFTGPRCGDVDGCVSAPCRNGATCHDVAGDPSGKLFTCTCAVGKLRMRGPEEGRIWGSSGSRASQGPVHRGQHPVSVCGAVVCICVTQAPGPRAQLNEQGPEPLWASPWLRLAAHTSACRALPLSCSYTKMSEPLRSKMKISIHCICKKNHGCS